VSSLGQIEEEMRSANVFATSGWHEITISPSMAHPGSGTARDLFERRIEEWTRRFYKEAGEKLRRLVERFGIGRLILAGPEERTAAFRSALPHEVRRLVVSRVHLPVKASEDEVVRRISGLEERLEREREKELLAQVGERGVRGSEATLMALQEGRVYLLIAPWPLFGEVRWCDSCALASATEAREEERCPYCGGPTRRRSLSDASIELAAARDARIELVRGENANTLRGRFGGLAGLTRF
jgi:peptide subunit release factor 1 (eRF1)